MVTTAEKQTLATLHKSLVRCDVGFPDGKMPQIYNAVIVKGINQAEQEVSVTCVQQLPDNQVGASYFHEYHRWLDSRHGSD